MFTSRVEVSIVKLFVCNLRYSRFVKAHKLLGVNPENEFEDMSSLVSLEPLEIKLGISPLRLFIPTNMNSRFGSPMPMSVGRLPES